MTGISNSRLFVARCVAGLAVTLFVVAASRIYAHEHGAHEHGIGQLDVAIEGATIQMELSSPAVNLIGFEHPPRNAGERDALDHAVEALRGGTDLFRFDKDARCVLRDASVTSPLLVAGADSAHDDDDEDGHEGHADLAVSWRFDCANPGAVAGLDAAAFFARFPQTEKLRLQAVTTQRQSAGELTAQQPKFRF